MEIEENGHTAKPRKSLAGVLVMAFAILTLIAAICRVVPKGLAVDFPCHVLPPGSIEQEIVAETRIAYCISLYPRYVEGGNIYRSGVSGENRLTLAPSLASFWYGNLVFERHGDDISVNGQGLQPGETGTWVRWFPSINPWLLLLAHFTVTNDGTIDSVGQNAIHISGAVSEAWLPSPLGLVILGTGIWFWKRNRAIRDTSGPGPLND
ncbi:MAG: hypothetical protein JXA21_01200 [Anaerolineae bacterium]|nr:hypothetical protein [Anaerolineae bacterium]